MSTPTESRSALYRRRVVGSIIFIICVLIAIWLGDGFASSNPSPPRQHSAAPKLSHHDSTKPPAPSAQPSPAPSQDPPLPPVPSTTPTHSQPPSAPPTDKTPPTSTPSVPKTPKPKMPPPPPPTTTPRPPTPVPTTVPDTPPSTIPPTTTTTTVPVTVPPTTTPTTVPTPPPFVPVDSVWATNNGDGSFTIFWLPPGTDTNGHSWDTSPETYRVVLGYGPLASPGAPTDDGQECVFPDTASISGSAYSCVLTPTGLWAETSPSTGLPFPDISIQRFASNRFVDRWVGDLATLTATPAPTLPVMPTVVSIDSITGTDNAYTQYGVHYTASVFESGSNEPVQGGTVTFHDATFPLNTTCSASSSGREFACDGGYPSPFSTGVFAIYSGDTTHDASLAKPPATAVQFPATKPVTYAWASRNPDGTYTVGWGSGENDYPGTTFQVFLTDPITKANDDGNNCVPVIPDGESCVLTIPPGSQWTPSSSIIDIVTNPPYNLSPSAGISTDPIDGYVGTLDQLTNNRPITVTPQLPPRAPTQN